MHALLRSLDPVPDSRPIQRVDEEQPERCADEHHAEHEYEHGAHGGLWRNDHRKHTKIEERTFRVEEIIYKSLNEPRSVGPPTVNLVRVECPGTRSNTHDPKVDEIRSGCVLEGGKHKDAFRNDQADAEHAVGNVDQISGENTD